MHIEGEENFIESMLDDGVNDQSALKNMPAYNGGQTPMNNPPSEELDMDVGDDESLDLGIEDDEANADFDNYDLDIDDVDLNSGQQEYQQPEAPPSRLAGRESGQDTGRSAKKEIKKEKMEKEKEACDDVEEEPDPTIEKFNDVVEIEMFNCAAFERIGRFILPKTITLNEEVYGTGIIEGQESGTHNARKSGIKQLSPRKASYKRAGLQKECQEQLLQAMEEVEEITLKSSEYHPTIRSDRKNNVKFNQAKCDEIISRTQNKMTDIEMDAFDQSSLIKDLRGQMDGKTNTYQFDLHKEKNVAPDMQYQQDFYLWNNQIYIVLQAGQMCPRERVCELNLQIFEYNYNTKKCKIKSPIIPVEQGEAGRSNKKLFLLSRFDFEAQTEEYREIKWRNPQDKADSDTRIPFYVLFFQKYDNICQQKQRSSVTVYDTMTQSKPFISENILLINQYVLIYFYSPCGGRLKPLRFEYEIRNLDLLQRSLCMSMVAHAQFQHEVRALYFNQWDPLPNQNGDQNELNNNDDTANMEMAFKALEFLRVEMFSKSDEYEVDQSLVKQGLCLKYMSEGEKVAKQESDAIYKGLDAELRQLRQFMYNEDGKHDVQISTIATNTDDDTVYKTEYTYNLQSNEHYLTQLLDPDFRSKVPKQSSEFEYIDVNDPDYVVPKAPPTKSIFLKDQNNNKLLIIKVVPDQYIDGAHKFIILQSDLHQNQLCPMKYQQLNKCMSKVFRLAPYSCADHDEYQKRNYFCQATGNQQQLDKTAQEFVDEIFRSTPEFRSPLVVLRQAPLDKDPVVQDIKGKSMVQSQAFGFATQNLHKELKQNDTNLYLGKKEEYFLSKGLDKKMHKYKIEHNEEFFTSQDETVLPFMVTPYDSEKKKKGGEEDGKKKEEEKDEAGAFLDKIGELGEKVGDIIEDAIEDGSDQDSLEKSYANLGNVFESHLAEKPLRIIPMANQFKEYDQKQIPMLINSIKFQTYYLALLDLENRVLLDVRQLDLNKQEYQDSNDPEIIYSSEIYIDELPVIEKKDNDQLIPFADPLALAQFGEEEATTYFVIRQNYHCIITFKNRQRIIMFEFLLEWIPKLKEEEGLQVDISDINLMMKKGDVKFNAFDTKMKLIGRRDFIACVDNKNFPADSKYAFVERYQDHNNLIKGINITCQTAPGHYESYLIPNSPLEEESIIESEFAYTRKLKIYSDEVLDGILVSVRLKDRIICDPCFSQYDINQLIRTAVKTCLNMIHIDIEDLLYREIKFNDAYQSVDVLYGMSVLDLFCNNPQRVQKCLTQSNEASRPGQLASIIQTLMDNVNCVVDHMKEDLMVSNIYRDKNELTFDFNQINVLERCMKKTNPQTLSADIILAHVFQQKYNIYNQKVLTMFLPHVIQSEKYLNNYYQFLGIEIDDYDDDQSDENKRLELNIKLKEIDDLPRFSKLAMELQVLNTKGQNPVDDLTDMIRDMVYHSQNIGTDYEVEHNYVDFRFLLFNQKIKQLLFSSEDFQFVEQITEFEIAHYMCNIVEAAGKKIQQFQIVRSIVDEQFNRTREYFINQMYIYLFGFLTPFIMQVFDVGKLGVCACLGVCATTLVYFMRQELLQVQDQGWGYLGDLWNFFDGSGIVVFVALIFTRLLNLRAELTLVIYDRPYEDELGDTIELSEEEISMIDYSIGLKFMCFFLLFQSVMKILFFLRIFDSFGLLVQLIIQSIQDIKMFFVFLLAWQTVFTLQYLILGFEVEKDEYPEMPHFARTMLQCWRNSILEGETPQYQLYVETDHFGPVYYIWVIWIFQSFLIYIMLLNFMIAIVSQSYELVMSQKEINQYMHRSQLNRECRLLKKASLSSIDILIFSVAKEQGEVNEWEGFTATLKSFVNKQSSQLKEKLYQDLRSKMGFNKKNQEEKLDGLQRKVTELGQSRKQMSKQITELLSLVKAKHGS